jgi:hypothetical protein
MTNHHGHLPGVTTISATPHPPLRPDCARCARDCAASRVRTGRSGNCGSRPARRTAAAHPRPSEHRWRRTSARLDLRIVGVADDDARRLEAFGGDAPEALAGEHLAHSPAKFLLLLADALEAVALGFQHHVTQGSQRVGRHRRVVGMAAAFEGFHDLHPFLEVASEAATGRRVDPGARSLAEDHQRAAGRARPAFLRGADQDVDLVGDHVDPHRTGSDAIEHEQAVHRPHRLAHGTQVVVGQNHPRGSLDVRRKNDRRPFGADAGHDVVDRRWRERRLRSRRQAAAPS